MPDASIDARVVSLDRVGTQAEWDRFVVDHIAEVWSQAAAQDVTREEAAAVCELVWFNAAQRFPDLMASSDARSVLLADVTREARRTIRRRATQLHEPGLPIG